MPELTWELGLGIIGIVVSVYFGVRAMNANKRKKQDQRQKLSGGSIGIQSGRDTNINE